VSNSDGGYCGLRHNELDDFENGDYLWSYEGSCVDEDYTY
jgi:hypothetical protein